MTAYAELRNDLQREPRRWLVTGAAGFIGSHLVETLLRLGQQVVGLDSFSTGKRGNLDEIRAGISAAEWARFQFIEGDIRQLEHCRAACTAADYVLHQAALGSVPRSMENPLDSHASNVDGFVNMLVAARDARVRRFVFASSSSVYGDDPALSKVETVTGRSLSPYAATKVVNELYADVFYRCYGLPTIGLRYFNVFGPRQDPTGAYAAVIPKWFAAILRGEDVIINGDGEMSRDFCFIANTVQANLLAATTTRAEAIGRSYNVACGDRTTLRELHARMLAEAARHGPGRENRAPIFGPERTGDVRHSLADISLASEFLGYRPSHSLEEGLKEAGPWYFRQLSAAANRG